MSLLLLLALVAQSPDSARFAAEAARVLASGRHPDMRWPVLSDERARADSLYEATSWRPLWLDSIGKPSARSPRPGRDSTSCSRWMRSASRGR